MLNQKLFVASLHTVDVVSSLLEQKLCCIQKVHKTLFHQLDPINQALNGQLITSIDCLHNRNEIQSILLFLVELLNAGLDGVKFRITLEFEACVWGKTEMENANTCCRT